MSAQEWVELAVVVAFIASPLLAAASADYGQQSGRAAISNGKATDRAQNHNEGVSQP